MKIKYKKLLPITFILFVILLIAGVSFYFLNEKKSQQYRDLLTAEQNHLEAQERLNNADKDLRLYKQYEGRYQKFEAMGFFNKEERANLTENIVEAGKKTGVFDLKMELAPQAIMYDDLEYAVDETYLSDAQWRRSEQKISFSALHEIDALKFFQSLDWDKRLQQFERCTFSSQRIVLSPSAKNVEVLCQLNWSTLYLLPKEDKHAP